MKEPKYVHYEYITAHAMLVSSSSVPSVSVNNINFTKADKA